MSKYIKIFFLLVLMLGLFSCDSNRKKPPTAKNGVLDLRGWDFEKDGIVRLDGEWEFYWEQFLKSKDFDTVNKKHYISVPDYWTNYNWNNYRLPGMGYVSYRLRIITNEHLHKGGLKILSVGSSYQLFINDSLFGRNGIAGISPKTTVPQYVSTIYSIEVSNDTTDIVCHVSNFHYRKGGLWESIEFGNENQIRKSRDLQLVQEYLLAGGFLIIFLYFLILYFFRNQEKASLFFGFICLVAFVRVISTGERFLTEIFPNMNWEYVIKSELLTLHIFPVLGCYYMYYLFKNESLKYIVIFELIHSIVSCLITIFTNATIHSHIVIPNQIITSIIILYWVFICIKALMRKREGALLNLISLILYLLAITNAFLFYNNIVNTFDTAILGILLFVVVQLTLISKKFSGAYSRIEHFAIELENTVEIRTKELHIEKEKTEELLKTSDRLLLNVLPESIANRLKAGETQIADHFDEASVVFIDIVDFTKLSAKSTPQKMVKLLNEIFTIFDKIAAKYGLEKIKTIGDCYMAAAGIPIPRSDHAQAIAMMALEVIETMKSYRSEDNQQIQFRIGLDCGPIVAGVIGEQKFIYDLWGDMVNTASRMETNGVIGKIQCTERFKQKLTSPLPLLTKEGTNDEVVQGWSFLERGEIEIKGKGMMRTWLLESHGTDYTRLHKETPPDKN